MYLQIQHDTTCAMRIDLVHTIYVILCHALSNYIILLPYYLSFYKTILNCLFSQPLGPARLALVGRGCLNLFPNACGQVGQVEPAGRQKHQRLLEQLQSLLHLAVRRWMSKSRIPRRPLSCRQHHKCKTSKSSLPFLILSCSSLDAYPFRTSHILLPTVSSLHSTLFTSNVSSLVVPTATESRTLAPANSDDSISSILESC